jgi:hypothetical protein
VTNQVHQTEVEQSIEAGPPRQGKPGRFLGWGAAMLGAVCAAAAFLVLLLHDGSRTKVMVHDQSAPVARPATTAAPPTPSAAAYPRVAPPEIRDAAQKEADAAERHTFRLQKGRRAVTLGPVRFRLTRVDTAQGMYDISVLSGRRSYSHKHVRVNEPLWISLARGKGALELVASSVAKDGIEGYWVQTPRSPQVKANARKK